MNTYTTINISPDELKGLISETLSKVLISNQRKAPNQQKELMTVKELAKLLKKTTKTIYQWKEENKIPYIQTDKTILFDYDEVMETLKNWKKLNKSMGAL